MATAATTTPAPAPTAAAPAPALNEASIAQALTFLKDARVVSTTTTRKVEFLKKKGLSQADIAEAFKRAYPNSTEWQDILAVRAPMSTAPSFDCQSSALVSHLLSS